MSYLTGFVHSRHDPAITKTINGRPDSQASTVLYNVNGSQAGRLAIAMSIYLGCVLF